jgi:hypothetical protein
MKLQVFEAVVLLHPREFQKNVVLGPADEENTTLVCEVRNILALDMERARSIASTKIPVEFHDRLERVEVLVRPF